MDIEALTKRERGIRLVIVMSIVGVVFLGWFMWIISLSVMRKGGH